MTTKILILKMLEMCSLVYSEHLTDGQRKEIQEIYANLNNEWLDRANKLYLRAHKELSPKEALHENHAWYQATANLIEIQGTEKIEACQDHVECLLRSMVCRESVGMVHTTHFRTFYKLMLLSVGKESQGQTVLDP